MRILCWHCEAESLKIPSLMSVFCKSLASLSCWVLGVLMAEACAAQVLTNDVRKPGTLRMVQILERVARESKPMENRFLSRGRVVGLRAALAAGPSLEKA